LTFHHDTGIQRNTKILLAPAFAKAMAGTANIFDTREGHPSIGSEWLGFPLLVPLALKR